MDPKTLREQALSETERFFLEKFGTKPAEDSDEWEDEYRRQFNRLKAAPAPPAAAQTAPVVEEKPADLPDLIGTPADARWALALRAARLKEVQSRDLRDWLAHGWTKAKDWIDFSRDLPLEAFLRRVGPAFAEASRKSASVAAAAATARHEQEAAAAALQAEITAAGISAAGLIELVDVSPRTASLPIKDKLAEIRLEGRTVRIFETTSPETLMVLEKRDDQRSDYGIERDEGLVADLKLFARAGS